MGNVLFEIGGFDGIDDLLFENEPLLGSELLSGNELLSGSELFPSKLGVVLPGKEGGLDEFWSTGNGCTGADGTLEVAGSEPKLSILG